jgi:hypothetical protein
MLFVAVENLVNARRVILIFFYDQGIELEYFYHYVELIEHYLILNIVILNIADYGI